MLNSTLVQSCLYFFITARINVGRIAALLAYCYRLCKAYIQSHLPVGGLMGFVMMVAGWLFKFLLKAKFYEWLDKQGGWVSFQYPSIVSSSYPFMVDFMTTIENTFTD